MLTEYIQAAMRHAKYEILADDGTIYGHIDLLRGVWANEKTLEACREELRRVLEDWILYCVEQGIKLPVIDRINLNARKPRSPRRRKVA
jgi:hypothetical protein